VRVVNNARIADLRSEPELTDEYCSKKLTSYEVQTLRPFNVGGHEARGDSRSSKNSKKSKSSPSWIKVEMTQGYFEVDAIRRNIKVLDKSKSVTERFKDLRSRQSSHVAKLVESKNRNEFDKNFTWTLTQLDRKMSKSRQTESITVYLKRAPLSDLSPVTVFQEQQARIEQARTEQQRMEQARAEHARMEQQRMEHQRMEHARAEQQRMEHQRMEQQRMEHQRMEQQRMEQQARMEQQRMEQQARMEQARPPPPMIHDGNMGQPRKNRGESQEEDGIIDLTNELRGNKSLSKLAGVKGSGSRKEKERYSDKSSADSSSDSGSDSDSEASSSDSGTNPSSMSSRDRRRGGSYHHKEEKGHRIHEKGYKVIEKPRRRSPAVFVPEPPRRHSRSPSREPAALRSMGVAQEVADGIVAGVAAATRAAMIDQAPPRSALYSTRSQWSSPDSSNDNVIRVPESPRSRGDYHGRDNMSSYRDRADLNYFNEPRTKEDLRASDGLREVQELKAAVQKLQAQKYERDLQDKLYLQRQEQRIREEEDIREEQEEQRRLERQRRLDQQRRLEQQHRLEEQRRLEEHEEQRRSEDLLLRENRRIRFQDEPHIPDNIRPPSRLRTRLVGEDLNEPYLGRQSQDFELTYRPRQGLHRPRRPSSIHRATPSPLGTDRNPFMPTRR
jgi:hypothetical protein